jgi:hypothetical protein
MDNNNETNQEWFESQEPEVDFNELNKAHVRPPTVYIFHLIFRLQLM